MSRTADIGCGQTGFLIPWAPRWRRAVEVRARVATAGGRGLTGREFREPLGASLRVSIKWEATLERAELNELRGTLWEMGDAVALCPVWPFVRRGVDWPGPVTSGGGCVGFDEEWSTWELNPSTPSAWEFVAPVLWGRIEVDAPSLLTPDAAHVGFSFVEDSTADLGLALDAVTWATGPALNDATIPNLSPFVVEWGRPPKSGAPVVEITRREIGRRARTRAGEFFPQAPALPVEGRACLDGTPAIAAALRWWADVRGDVGPHYVRGLANVARLTSDAAAGQPVLNVSRGADLGAYRFLALTDLDRTQFVRVDTVVGNVVTLTANLDFAVPASALVEVFILARHADAELELSFRASDYAETRAAWVEVPEEYIAGAGETRGSTLGAGGLRAFLYRFTVDRAGSPTFYRFTSFERDLTASAETWVSSPMDHNEIAASVRLDRDDLDIECRVAPWCDEFLPGRLTARVLFDVFECSVSGSTGSSVAQVFAGEVVSVTFSGPFVKARVQGIYSTFDRPVPRVVIQPACNHTVFDSACGLSKAAWTFTATESSHSGRSLTLGSWARSGGLPSGWGVSGYPVSGYFAFGYVERASGERLAIIGSTILSSGLVTLSLDRSVEWETGESVSVVPGCDGKAETCRDYHATNNPLGKFDNFGSFLGFPLAPAKNPSFTIPKKSTSTHGKK